MQTQPTQIVGDPPRGDLAGLFPQQRSKMLAKVVVGEGARDEKEQQQNLQEGLNAGSANRSDAARWSPTIAGFCMSWNAAWPMKQS